MAGTCHGSHVEALASRNSVFGKLSRLPQDHEFPGRAWGRCWWGADLSPGWEGGHQPLGLPAGSGLDTRPGEGSGSPGREGGEGGMGRGRGGLTHRAPAGSLCSPGPVFSVSAPGLVAKPA